MKKVRVILIIILLIGTISKVSAYWITGVSIPKESSDDGLISIGMFPISIRTSLVTFDTQGGNNISPLTLTFGRDYSLPIPFRSGSRFISWQLHGTDLLLTGIWSIEEDALLVAYWSE
jgi:hypothetical protein